MNLGNKRKILMQYVTAVVKRAAHAVLIVGPPGIGKSHEVAEAIRRQGDARQIVYAP